MLHSTRMAVIAGMLAVAAPALADWTPPADKRFTEEQLKNYIETADDWADVNSHLLEAISSSKNDTQKMAAVGELDEQHKECLQRHHIGEGEFEWIAARTVEAWGVATYIDDGNAKAQTDLAARLADNDQKLAEAQKRLETFQDALKSGERVLSPEEHEAAIKTAKDDQQVALDEVKHQQEDASTADHDADEHDAEAQKADALANSPPGNMGDAERAAYVKDKNDDAQKARDAAKDARDRTADARKAQADSQALADAKGREVEHPEIPATDDEKASAKDQNEAGIVVAKSDIDTCRQIEKQLTIVQGQMKKSAEDLEAGVPAENVQLMRKYSMEYRAMLDKVAGLAATRPAN